VDRVSSRCAADGLATYDLVSYASARLSSTSSNNQVSTSVGIEVGRVDGVRELMLRIGNIRLGLERHYARGSSVDSSISPDYGVASTP
jgi:hypothetical protein